MANSVIIGIDVGLTGGISIFEDNDSLPLVYKMPVKKITVNKKNKNVYDMVSIVDILDKYKNKDVLYFIEKQGVRPGEGAVSAMTIGKGFGQLLGAAYAFKFKIIEVTPQSWKKHFPELITDDMLEIKGEMKILRALAKELKDKESKKENKKQVDKLGREFKSLAKTEARKLVSKIYPELAHLFEKKNSDGLAESLLIAIFGKSTQNELI